jgi:hypothetical protein
LVLLRRRAQTGLKQSATLARKQQVAFDSSSFGCLAAPPLPAETVQPGEAVQGSKMGRFNAKATHYHFPKEAPFTNPRNT